MDWILFVTVGLSLDILVVFVIVNSILRFNSIYIKTDFTDRMRHRDPSIDKMIEKSKIDSNFMQNQKRKPYFTKYLYNENQEKKEK